MKNIMFSFPMLFRNGLTFLSFYYFADVFEPEVFGLFNLSFSYMIILNSAVILSLGSGYVRYYYENDDENKGFNLCFFIVAAVIVFSNGAILFCIKSFVFTGELIGHATLIISSSMVYSLSELYLLKVRLENNLRLFTILNLSIVLIFISCIAFFSSNGLTLDDVFYAFLCQFIFAFMMYIYFILSRLSEASWNNFKLNFSLLKKAVIFSLFILPGNFGYLINDSIDKFIINGFLSVGDVAVYSFTYQLAFVFLFVSAVITRVSVTPYILKNYKSDDISNKVNSLITRFCWLFFVSFVFLVMLKDYIYIHFDSNYTEAAKYFPLTLVAVFFAALSNVFVINIHLSEKSYLDTIIELTTGVLNFAFSWMLIPKIGIVGGYISTYLSFAYRMICYLIVGRNVFGKLKYDIKGLLVISFLMSIISLFLGFYDV